MYAVGYKITNHVRERCSAIHMCDVMDRCLMLILKSKADTSEGTKVQGQLKMDDEKKSAKVDKK